MSRLPLRTPLGSWFDQRLPEETVHRLWLRIAQGPPARQPWPWRLVLVAAAALLCLALGAALYVTAGPAPLRLAGREKLPAQLVAVQPRTVAFDDGSSIELGRATRLDVLENTERQFVLAVRSGQARFSVEPGGPRTWRVESGPVSVEVVGTRFLVARSSAAVRVEVDHGRVLVRGEGVPDRVARLGARETLVVPLGLPAAATAAGVSGSPASAAPAVAPRVIQQGAGDAAGASAPSLPAARTKERVETPRSPASPGAAASAPEAAPDAVGTLLYQADVARREGAYARAAALLERVTAEHPRDARVALAHFTLGRLYLDSLGEPGRATAHFARSIESGVPDALAEDAHARLVQARASAGDRAGAESAAARYRALYPAGRHVQDVERWVAAMSGR